ncbi:MAG: winged helix-turn-helix domain-containing protein [Oscillospiraceae bacterium]|nr:winged helix-turn-helix domain-containing protein [Oscillospiraceae bacterium]
MNTILAVDTSAAVHERQTAEWVKYDIDTIRVDAISEAASRLARGNFLFVAVNEDSIPGFMPQLRAMRDAADIPIFVLTSHYTIDKKIQAMNCGADVYDAFDAYRKDDVLTALELLKSPGGYTAYPQKALRCGDISLLPPQRSVFVKNIEVTLTKKEFDILQYLISNRGCVVTHIQLLKAVWGGGHDMSDIGVLWRTVDRLRKKLSEAFPAKEYIKVERGLGYKIIT